MNPYLRKKIEERAAVGDLISSTLETCAKDNRDPNADEKAKLDQWSLRCAELDQEIAQLETRARANANFAATVGRLGQAEERQEQRQEQERDKPKVETRSAGQIFVESDAFKSFGGRGTSDKLDFGGFLETRAAITLDTISGLINPHVVPGPATPVVLSPLLNVISRIPVAQNVVSYVKWGLPPEAGGPIAEGELKPEAEITVEDVEATLGTYAHWKPITRQALEDVPQIRGIVETVLRLGLVRRLERGAGEALTSATVTTTLVDDLTIGVRHAIAELQNIGLGATAVGLNPFDYADMDIAAAASSNSGPVRTGEFWNLPTVPIPSLARGNAYVGDFATAISWFDRNNAAVYLTDSHEDYFVRNKLVILAEQRAKFDVVDPTAIVKVTTNEAPEALAAPKSKAAAAAAS